MKKKPNRKVKNKKLVEIVDYDSLDTSSMIDENRRLEFKDIGFKLPETEPTQVVSIRLPSHLLNEIRALGSQRDIPYQALIKLFLADSVAQMKRKT